MEKEVSLKTDLELIEAAWGGDVESFGKLASRYYTPIVALAHSKVDDKHLAEDIAQETFTKACFKISELKDKNKFGSWLGKICINLCADSFRRHRNSQTVELSGELESAKKELEEFEIKDEQQRIRNIIRELPDKLRQVIYMRYYDGMTYEMIEDVLGISRQAVSGRLRRAKKIIGKKLKG